jgi:putative glutamine amidotransferase
VAKTPLIGVTTSFDQGEEEPFLPGKRLLFVTADYVEALQSTGASVVILPLAPDKIPPVVEHLSGLVVTGNEKPLPSRMMEVIDSVNLHDQNPDRYTSDARWIRCALERQMPLLGICRGMQTLNDVLAGTIGRLPQLPDGRSHAQTDAPAQTWHSLQIRPDTLLHRVLGVTETSVNSFHVQGVTRPGAGVVFTGFAPGGTVEALEYPALPFCLGLQFHPEKLVGTTPLMRRIFDALVSAATAYQSASARGQTAPLG